MIQSFPLRRILWVFLFPLFLFPFQSADAATSEFEVDFEADIHTGDYKKYALDSEHFTFEFGDEVANGPDEDSDNIADLVQEIAEYSEFSWTKEVDEAGFPSPLDDQDKVLIILDDEAEYVTEDSYGITHIFDAGTDEEIIYIAIDPSSDSEILKVTIAHELLHVIQFGYIGFYAGYNQDLYFSEATAVWVEDYVYSDVNDYWNYLVDFFTTPYYSIFTGSIPEDSLFEYGATVWPMFLDQYLEDSTVVRQVIGSYFADEMADVWDAYQAYERILRENYNQDIREVFQTFALWNYVGFYYEDGANYPMLSVDETYEVSDYPLSKKSISDSHEPALFASNVLQFDVDSSFWNKDFILDIEKPKGIDWGVQVLPETEEEYLLDDLFSIIIDDTKTEQSVSQTIGKNVTRLTVILTPFSKEPESLESEEEAFIETYSYSYSFSIEGMEVSEETEDDQDEDEENSEEEDDDDDDDDEEEEEEQENQELEDDFDDFAEEYLAEFDESTSEDLIVSGLKVTSSDTDSVSLQWNRVAEEGTAGYLVAFGKESGNYADYITIEGEQKIRATVPNLLTGSTYYFVVMAYTEDGFASSDYSNEVSADLVLSTFSDVAQSHRNYYAIQFLSYLDVIKGYSDKTFKSNNPINRAELMKILVLGVGEIEPDATQYKNCFPDVTTEWFAPYVCYAAEQGWVKGYTDGGFHPENPVSKAEALKMILEANEIEVPSSASVKNLPFDDVFGSAWYAPYLVTAYELGFLEETGGSFSADQSRTRAEVTEELFRSMVIKLMAAEEYNQDVFDEFMVAWGEVF